MVTKRYFAQQSLQENLMVSLTEDLIPLIFIKYLRMAWNTLKMLQKLILGEKSRQYSAKQ